MSRSDHACNVRVHANKGLRSLFDLSSPESESKTQSQSESGGSKADLLGDPFRLIGTLIEKSSWERYLRMWVAALATGEAQKSVLAMRPARTSVTCELSRLFVVVQLSVTSVEREDSVKIVHTFTDVSGL